MKNEAEQSPMLAQYNRIKREHKDDVLLFRLGDFYEMFADDAIEIAALLNLTLTSRNGIPMCGVPYHAVDQYIARLLKLGKKVAICEQLSHPVKGLVERKVVEIITPGTTVNEEFLETGSSNYLASFAPVHETAAFAYLELSTGEFFVTSFPTAQAQDRIRQERERLQIKEIIVPESFEIKSENIRHEMVINRFAGWFFEAERNRERLIRQFGTVNMKGFALADNAPEIIAAGVLLTYLDNASIKSFPHIRSLTVYHENEYMNIDESSLRNLELVYNLRDGNVKFSLLEVMDKTKTPAGQRLLKRRILHPVQNSERINKRLDMVEMFYSNQKLLNTIRDILSKTPDLERLISRIAMDKALGRDMLKVKNALFRFNEIEEILQDFSCTFETKDPVLFNADSLVKLMELRDLLEQALVGEPALTLGEGNLIRAGYSQALDRLHKIQKQGFHLLEDYVGNERQTTGIPTLKIRYNRLIGYFIEVSNQYLPKVPPYFIRRQGLAGSERFSTERLVELEAEINGASDKIIEMERQLFLELRNSARSVLPELEIAAHRIAELDVAQSSAYAAILHRWVRPELNSGTSLKIIEGRHPVVEFHLPAGEFIKNNCVLDGSMVSFALITGPNMAGKSTYLRQNALITIMAQMGSFVPATEAVIGIVDRIYCRVGASDNLARGESTFLVEMNETAAILNTATEKSFVIMDEVGRGTGTNDGLAIAWAVSEELLSRIQCRTLFATHYHELSRLSHSKKINLSMEVLDKEEGLVFLRRIQEGAVAKSYGIYVARLAGLSEHVRLRAEAIMERLEESDRLLDNEKLSSIAPPPPRIFPGESIIRQLSTLDTDRLTPLEALQYLCDWKKMLNEKSLSNKHGTALARQDTKSLFD
ncbi:MAG: DNA mismatch repair protein MutS [Spirochaetaceae bacterium]|jgi:DNA mismatch repair protein MutS|nr:DNA mismatch repair protein MutS [Spirochaetaceae bacterium]